MTECISRSLAELEEKRKKIGAESMDAERKLEAVRAKEERLGIAFADGAVNENAYKSNSSGLRRKKPTSSNAGTISTPRSLENWCLSEYKSTWSRMS
jgi:hypothetical protein